MASADCSVAIARPVEDVFAVLTDPTLTPKWSPLHSGSGHRPHRLQYGPAVEAMTSGSATAMTSPN
jgi:hypothetical protein